MKYKAIIETDEFKDFEFYEDGNGKYIHGIDAGSVNGEWIPLYFTECEQEPCGDCINRQDAVNACRNGWGYDDETIKHIIKNILELPPVQPEQKTGRWISVGADKLKCSECEVIHLIFQYPYGGANFCPNCGVKMK